MLVAVSGIGAVKMGKKDDEIQEKLAELEASIVEEKQQHLAPEAKGTAPAREGKKEGSVQSDLYMLFGLGLLITGFLAFLNHVKVTSGYMSWLGFHNQGFGLVLLPLVFGMGMLFYDHKNPIGWVVTAATLGMIIFAVLSHLVMVFPSMSLLGVIIMFLPLAAGGALVMKALKARDEGGK